MKRKLYLASVLVVALVVVTAQPAAAASVSWGTSSDWDNATSDSVVHESTANTDYNNALNVRLGYSPGDPLYKNSLVAYYPFQEDSGDTAYDFSENDNSGTIEGASPGTSGLLGTTAYDFDGGDDGVSIPNLGVNLDGSDSFTFSGWVKPDQFGGKQMVLSLGAQRELYLAFGDDVDDDKFTVRRENSNGFGNPVTSPSLSTSDWHHLSVTYHPDNGWLCMWMAIRWTAHRLVKILSPRQRIVILD